MVFRLPEGQGQERRNDMTRAAGEGHIIPAVQVLAQRQPIKRVTAVRFLLL